MKPITVQVTKYQAKDGLIFDSEQDAILHEKRIDSLVKDCSECNGLGKYEYGMAPMQVCHLCSGKGYVERKEVWR